MTTTKFLGVICDDKLKWSTHILHIWKKCWRHWYLAKTCFNDETLLTLYHTFVYTYPSYVTHRWDRAYHTHLIDLIVLQNKIIRIINGVPPRTKLEKIVCDIWCNCGYFVLNVSIIMPLCYSCTNMQMICFLNCLLVFIESHSFASVWKLDMLTETLCYSPRLPKGHESFSHHGPRV